MSTIKELREQKKLTQQQVAELAGISLRSYKSYENDPEKVGTIKYNFLVELLEKINPIDEEHGILELADIQQTCSAIFARYEVDYAYLFGSYAKGKATEKSDVDLLVATDTTGLKFYGLVEEIRAGLHKQVDVLDLNQLKNNFELTQEIMRDGIKIYG